MAMKPNINKFEQQIRTNVVDKALAQNWQPTNGIILNYDKYTNTATVLAAQPGSLASGEIYKNVPCPTTVGVQGVAPDIGRSVGLTFKDGTAIAPMVTHYYNHNHVRYDYVRQYQATNTMPRHLYYM